MVAYENDNFNIDEKYKEMSIDEIREEKERVLKEIKEKKEKRRK